MQLQTANAMELNGNWKSTNGWREYIEAIKVNSIRNNEKEAAANKCTFKVLKRNNLEKKTSLIRYMILIEYSIIWESNPKI